MLNVLTGICQTGSKQNCNVMQGELTGQGLIMIMKMHAKCDNRNMSYRCNPHPHGKCISKVLICICSPGTMTISDRRDNQNTRMTDPPSPSPTLGYKAHYLSTKTKKTTKNR
ncbi:hypothetical protein GDO86_003748 [Hymenochirus boettgeri]|uniref:Uncharacterized protein n=1 Tax=Hymenochirus boettgeri TaxID=247094 RepID=A0A8T2K777_9PIPI|nr:hypothetical protein GDO86_003748 [Hymenochirus boettgeri]